MTYNTLQMIIGRFLFICLLLVSGLGLLYAQDFNPISPKYYSVKNGLSYRLITDIIQSNDGFIWLATPNGLNKFDGYEFVKFNDSASNVNQISGINIKDLFLDKDGNIIIVYHNRIRFFDILNPRTHQVTKIDVTHPESGIKGLVRQIITNNKKEILFVTTGMDGTYLFRFEGENGFNRLFFIPENRDRQSVTASLLELSNNTYLLYDTEKGLRLIKNSGSLVKTFAKEDFITVDTAEFSPGSLDFMYKDDSGRAWLSFKGAKGVFLFSDKNNTFIQSDKLPLQENYSYVWEDQQGNLLFAKTNGASPYPEVENMYCLKSDNTFLDFSHLVDLGPRIISIFSEDFTKTILLGIDSGLKIAQNSVFQIKTFLATGLKDDQRGVIMRGIDGNNEKVYFAEESGIWYVLDLETDQLDTLEMKDAKTGNPVDMACSHDLLLDKQGFLWGISCNNLEQGQFHRCNPKTGLTETYTYKQRFASFTQSKNGTFWLLAEATPNNEKSRLISFDPNTGHFEPYPESELGNPLSESIPYYIEESRNGDLWIGTNNGLIKIDRQSNTRVAFKANEKESKYGLKGNTILVIAEDKDGLIWVGTNNGLSKVDPEANTITTYEPEKHGLASSIVCGIVPDEFGNLWVSTYYGISYFDREKDEFHNFFYSDGFSNDEFNRFSFYRDKNGRYYFGGVNGLNTFHANDLLTEEKIPTVALSKIVRLNSREEGLITKYDQLNPLKTIVITPQDLYFQLHFMLPKFKDPDRNQFKTWLKGYETDWTPPTNTPFIRYNRLPAGNYTLLIKGADPNGNWSKTPLEIQIVVKQIFYKTWWFWLACAIIIGAIGYWAFRYQWEQKLQVERFRTKLSSDLHDEMSGLLSGIAMQTDMLQLNSEDEGIKKRLRHIGEVSRKAMTKMSDVIWSIDARKDKMGDLIMRMREHADDILLPLNIQYSFEEKKIDRNHRVPPTIRQELYLIFKESINNVAKHSNANRVNIVLNNNEGGFVMEIEDNGQGIPKLHNGNISHSGQGLSNIKMRARRINAKIEILKDQGYTIKLRMRKFS